MQIVRPISSASQQRLTVAQTTRERVNVSHPSRLVARSGAQLETGL